MQGKQGLLEHISIIEDPRVDRTKLHKLEDIITIAIVAVICGCNGWDDIREFGEVHEDWFKTFLELPNGIPSHHTFSLVFSRIKPVQFETCFMRWTESLVQLSKGKVIAIDGKTVRRSHNRSSEKSAIHMVSAWASKNRMVLGQIKVDEKSNEITAIPELLNMLNIKDATITIDAMGCQKNIVTTIVANEANYVLALKGNQGDLYDDVKRYLDDAILDKWMQKDLHSFKTVEKNHGRIETRKHWITSTVDWIESKDHWEKLTSIGKVESERIVGGHVSKESRYYICSIPPDPNEFARIVREHWSIENSLHWVLDMAFSEDASRIRNEHAPEIFTVLRKIAMNLLKKETSSKRGIEAKRRRCGWDQIYLIKVLKGI